MKKGSLLIDSSTIDPAVSKELAKEVEKMGAVFMDAPVSGGKWQPTCMHNPFCPSEVVMKVLWYQRYVQLFLDLFRGFSFPSLNIKTNKMT